MTIRLAVDIGGTFTDLVGLVEEDRRILLAKASSTPPDFQEGVVETIRKSGLDPRAVNFFVHGSTVIINALTERRGARVALVTTRGFRDVLEITRSNRPDMYNLRFKKQEPFVPRELRFEIGERIDYRGRVLTPLNEDEVRVLGERLRGKVDAIAICFLHSYRNPSHELRCASLLSEIVEVPVTPSVSITQEWREYERSSTTVLNSYVQPVVGDYLESLGRELSGLELAGSRNVMKSNGGVSSFEIAKQEPIHMVESGPIGGVVGALAIGREIGEPNLITVDIGGTTAKTSLIEHGEVRVTTEYRIERDDRHAGYPVKVPVVDIVEIGAGGGSIAWIDPAGALHVGPRSAGAIPGPAGYDRGGRDLTVTDCNLILGRISPEYFLGGEMQLSVERAREAARPLTAKLGLSVEQVARGVIRLANANMVNAIKLVSVRKGHDPREYALAAFGGGGPMHAAALARELRIKRVVIPPAPGVFSAWGMLTTDYRQDFGRTAVVTAAEGALPEIQHIFGELEQDAVAFFHGEGIAAGEVVLERAADMRYRGQEHTVRVPLPGNDGTLDETVRRFSDRHQMAYLFTLEAPVEIVTFHVAGLVRLATPDLAAFAPPVDSGQAVKGHRTVDFDEDGIHDTVILRRDRLARDERIDGPAIVEEPAATTVVHPGQSLTADRIGNLVLVQGGE